MKTAIVYASVHHKNTEKVVKAIAEKHLRKKVFVMYTCGSDRSESYLKDIKDLIKSRECTLAAKYSCLAYDTFGPFKLIGGINKGHPNEADLQKAVDFYESLCK